MRRFLRLLLIVAVPALMTLPSLAGDFNNDTFVESRVFNIESVIGTDKVVVTFMLMPNDLQMCVCTLMVPQLKCICEMPPMGMCVERET